MAMAVPSHLRRFAWSPPARGLRVAQAVDKRLASLGRLCLQFGRPLLQLQNFRTRGRVGRLLQLLLRGKLDLQLGGLLIQLLRLRSRS